MVASGEYPDIIGAGQARGDFLRGEAFVALDEYLPNYPNLWKHFAPYESRLRDVSEDGKIYILDIWGRTYRLEDGQDDFYEGDYNGPAFWIQKDVLAWDTTQIPTRWMSSLTSWSVIMRRIPPSTANPPCPLRSTLRTGVLSA